jgi:uncharacterized protein YhhL (DUF1145 family)
VLSLLNLTTYLPGSTLPTPLEQLQMEVALIGTGGLIFAVVECVKPFSGESSCCVDVVLSLVHVMQLLVVREKKKRRKKKEE